jgi:hypothetical protein
VYLNALGIHSVILGFRMGAGLLLIGWAGIPEDGGLCRVMQILGFIALAMLCAVFFEFGSLCTLVDTMI